MPRVHDRGGWPTDGPIDKTDHPKADWEVRTHALNIVLGRKGIRRTDELRRAIESIEPAQYEAMSYYERWAEATKRLLVEKGLLAEEEIARKVAEIEQRGRR